MTGVNIVRINYKGPSMAISDIVTGRVQMMFLVASSVKAHIQSGKLRALATTTEKPTPLFPGVPTVAEAVPGYESAAQFGFFAPAKTPAAIVNRLSQETIRYLNLPEIRERYFNLGMEVVTNSPDQFAAIVKGEMARWAKLVKETGARVE